MRIVKKSVYGAVRALEQRHKFTLFLGDCRKLLSGMPDNCVDLIISSPPYFMGKEYDRSDKLEDFIRDHEELGPELHRILKEGGSLCWQVGTHVNDSSIVPLDMLAYSAFAKQPDFKLRNRIIWHFEHGEHSRKRFSGRYESILWFTKGDDYTFNLDAVRVPQKYPGKKHYKGPHKGKFSGNPAGKNPGDMWAVPNVKSKHCEKTEHPCQFPIAIPQRLIRALTRPNDIVFDPFAGVLSTGIAAAIEKRRFIGCEIEPSYADAGEDRYREFLGGTLQVRPWDQPVAMPDLRSAVARKPDHFRSNLDGPPTTRAERKEEWEGSYQ
jgi:adenine-specific DNA-methyltransferase